MIMTSSSRHSSFVAPADASSSSQETTQIHHGPRELHIIRQATTCVHAVTSRSSVFLIQSHKHVCNKNQKQPSTRHTERSVDSC